MAQSLPSYRHQSRFTRSDFHSNHRSRYQTNRLREPSHVPAADVVATGVRCLVPQAHREGGHWRVSTELSWRE